MDGGATSDPVEALERLVRAHLAVVTSDVEAASVFISEWRSLGPERRAAVLARRDAYERRFRDLIADGIAVGAFGLSDPAITATVLLSALNGVATWYDPAGRLGPDRIADHIADLAVRMLTAGPA